MIGRYLIIYAGGVCLMAVGSAVMSVGVQFVREAANGIIDSLIM